MATNINFDKLNVDSSGRVTFSGLGSGIDIQGTVNALIAAKRIPIDRIEQRISGNQLKVTALQDLNSLALGLKSAVARLRGAITFDGSSDIFKAKQVFATTSRTDSQTPSAATAILGVTATNRADIGRHSLEVEQIATARKFAADSATNQLGTLADNFNGGNAFSGSFELGLAGGATATIAVDGSMTLVALRDAINASSSASNVTASILKVSSTDYRLVLTAKETGKEVTITQDPGLPPLLGTDVLGILGLSTDDGATFKNPLSDAQQAQFTVDGVPLTRSSNDVDDVIDGVRLSLFKGEPGTTIDLGIERDLNQVKSAIVDFVDAYNELRSFINQQALTKVPEGDETGAGILARTSALSEVRARLSAVVGAAVDAEAPTFAVLAQIGITFRSAGQIADPLLTNTLAIDESKLDDALLTQVDAVRSLFALEMSSSSSNVLLAGFGANTSFSPGGYTLNVAYAGGAIVSANINGPADGSDDGSVTVTGKVLKVVAGGAEGLQLIYTGTSAASGIQLDLSVGIGAKTYGAVDALVNKTSGLIANEIGALKGQNELGQNRIERMQERLERERERLLERFVAMETALATMKRLLDGLRQQIDSSFNSDRR